MSCHDSRRAANQRSENPVLSACIELTLGSCCGCIDLLSFFHLLIEKGNRNNCLRSRLWTELGLRFRRISGKPVAGKR